MVGFTLNPVCLCLLQHVTLWQVLKNEVDVIAKENSTGKVYVSGFDRQGRPILVMRPREENTQDHDGNIKHIVYQVQH